MFSIGVKWIKQKYGEELKIIRIGQKGYLETIEQGLIQGTNNNLIIKISTNFPIILIVHEFHRQNCAD